MKPIVRIVFTSILLLLLSCAESATEDISYRADEQAPAQDSLQQEKPALEPVAPRPMSKRAKPRKMKASKGPRNTRRPRLPSGLSASKVASGGHFRDEGVHPETLTSVYPKSTFAADVDTGSYYFGRAYLAQNQRPPVASVRLEEWVNAFSYDYKAPRGGAPFAVHMALAPSPFQKRRHLLRIGVQGKEVPRKKRKGVHLVFLVDTSGSMRSSSKLSLVKATLHFITNALRVDDTVSIVTYAGSSEELLPATLISQKNKIHKVIDRLDTSGGTNMGTGMEMAYRNAGKHLGPDRISRVMVFSDGDANIGNTTKEKIFDKVQGYVSEGITLSTVGFGRGNYNDTLMEQLADAGNGNYTYVDSEAAAKKLFVDDLDSLLVVIAKDVKLQVEFDAKWVKRYRLLGYENRAMADRHFRDDKKDAGEIGAGHSVTALYELEFHRGKQPTSSNAAKLLQLHVRHKTPKGRSAVEKTYRLQRNQVKKAFHMLDRDARWAATMALTAEILRSSEYAKGRTFVDARQLGSSAASGPHAKERSRFLKLLTQEPNVARSTDEKQELSRKDILNVVNGGSGPIKKCLSAAARRRSHYSTRMTYRVRFHIQRNGHTSDIEMIDKGDGKLKKCLKKTLGALRFPAYRGKLLKPITLPLRA